VGDKSSFPSRLYRERTLQGLYFLLSFVAVAIVIRWCMTADGATGGEFKGLLAIKQESRARRRREGKAKHGDSRARR
jgi:hypothetical protein